MGLRINSNIAAFNAYRNLQSTDKAQNSALEKLSSGLRINKAADDAAGLAISENLRSQIGGLKVAVRNAQDGVNLVQTADGALTEVHSILQRMRDLAVQASNGGTQTTESQKAANEEFQELAKELGDIAEKTAFGGKNLLDGTYNGSFQVGANKGDFLDVSISASTAASTSFDSAGLGVDGLTLNSTSVALGVDSAQDALLAVGSAISAVSEARGKLGATQNRLEHKINNLNVTIENVTASESAIRDTDMAEEMTRFTRSQILSQAGTSMLAQANQSTQSVLSLLR
ncbi:flagellin N-terminal helical domain-containing protein [Kineococcus arenarius]|uniref:flagellin N-terminal helical domain-containing protein n=1 Tax=unclassified Kineococcus TaxID=2621656 RepID=UPI003D7EF004